ncbi:MAG TPA: hypothetical protein VGI97_12685, partial [Gemmatimonadaceae bacterium]
MNFLEASKIVARFSGGEALSFRLAMSGTAAPFEIFLAAAAATQGRTAQVSTLPFGTLAQSLHDVPTPGQTEVFLLTPWDFAPETDWRSGLPARELSFDEVKQRAIQTAQLLRDRRGARLLYLPAPVLPIFSDGATNAELATFLLGLSSSLGAKILPSDAFALSSFLATG